MSFNDQEQEYEEVKVVFLGQTDKAWKIELEDSGDEHWIPISQIEEELSDEFELESHGVIYVTKWFAEKEALT